MLDQISQSNREQEDMESTYKYAKNKTFSPTRREEDQNKDLVLELSQLLLKEEFDLF